MKKSDENDENVMIMVENGGVGPTAVGNHGGGWMGGNRRALSSLNRNVIIGPSHSCGVNKKGQRGKQGLYEKPVPLPSHRPITRKFAAQIANKQKEVVGIKAGGTHKPTRNVRGTREEEEEEEEEDCTIVEAEGYKESVEDSPPMFVQHTEAMLEEIDHEMEEVEMEDIGHEQVVDIDGPDKNNTLAVVEYIDDLYTFYWKMEDSGRAPPEYMEKQPDINEKMRGILIDWLIEVHYKFDLMDESLYLTVNIIDRYLAIHPTVRKKLQLVGVTAMLLACKYEEVSVPVVDDLVLISDKAYTRKEVLDMEKQMINALQFNLSIPTPYVFMRRFLKAAQTDQQLELLSFYMLELCLVEYEMLRFPPSMLSAAAIFTARCALMGSNEWTRTIQWHTSYSEEQLLECSKLMVGFHKRADTGKLRGVHQKYCLSRFGQVARTKPALFLVEDPLQPES